jgi:hypothetical protein
VSKLLVTLLTLVASVLSPISHEISNLGQLTWRASDWIYRSAESNIVSSGTKQVVTFLIETESKTYVYDVLFPNGTNWTQNLRLEILTRETNHWVCDKASLNCVDMLSRDSLILLDLTRVVPVLDPSFNAKFANLVDSLDASSSINAESKRQRLAMVHDSSRLATSTENWEMLVFKNLLSHVYNQISYVGFFGFQSIDHVFVFSWNLLDSKTMWIRLTK